jgi:hypothetical protein
MHFTYGFSTNKTIILPFVLTGCEQQPLNFTEKTKAMFEKKEFKKTCSPSRDQLGCYDTK